MEWGSNLQIWNKIIEQFKLKDEEKNSDSQKKLFWHPQINFCLVWKLTKYNFKSELKEVWKNVNASTKLGCCQNILSSQKFCFLCLLSQEKGKWGINCFYLWFPHLKISILQRVLESPVNGTPCDLTWLTHVRSSGFWLAAAAVGVLTCPHRKLPELSMENVTSPSDIKPSTAAAFPSSALRSHC